MKIMLGLLLPVLGLAGASYGLVDVPAGGAGHHGAPSLSAAAGRGDQKAARDVHPSSQALRNPGRRASVTSRSDGTLQPILVPACELAKLVPSAVAFRVVTAPPELVRRWQFHCRTAAEPRAPSTVS